MRIRRKTLGFILGVLTALAAVLAVSLAIGRDYPTRQTVRRTFLIDEPFLNVRKILVRNDSAKEIVKMGGDSDFIDQNWESFGADASKLLDPQQLVDPNWRIVLHGTLHVRTKDEYVGRHVIALDQDVEIEPDFLHSKVHLRDPSVRLKQYDMTTAFDRDPETGKARVTLELTQEILTDAPWFAHGIADRRVRQSAEKTLANQETAIRRHIEENKSNIPLLPLR
jgi:hypothetical protein